ncbi:MAG TPA: DUF2520 domain-containing protein [Thermoanaerobaculia bacterium]
MSEDLRDPTIVLVGPGRAGRAFARSWREVGGRLVLAGRDRGATRRFAGELSGVETRGLDGGAPLDGDVLILAVPDDAIARVAAALAPKGSWRVGLHFSGALGSDVLAPLASSGAKLASLHPLRAFNGAPAENWKNAFVAVEGDESPAETAAGICRRIGARPRRVPAAGKPLYHAAATLAAGGSASLLSLAARAWALAGLEEEEGRVALAELASTAVDAVARLPFDRAMTGPVARRDVATVRLHEDALGDRPDLTALYALLAAETLRRTPGRGKEKEIAALLGFSVESGPSDPAEIGKKPDARRPNG